MFIRFISLIFSYIAHLCIFILAGKRTRKRLKLSAITGPVGNLSQQLRFYKSQMRKVLAILNAIYAGCGYNFLLVTMDMSINKVYISNSPGAEEAKQIGKLEALMYLSCAKARFTSYINALVRQSDAVLDQLPKASLQVCE